MAATLSVISKRVGEGGVTNGTEVLRIQQLLTRVGFNPKSNLDGGWGKGLSTTCKAWIEFQKSKGWTPVNNFIDPTDAEDRLLWLVCAANVGMFVASWLRSASATSYLTNMTQSLKIPYGWVSEGKTYGGGTKVVWGFAGRPDFVLFTKGASASTAQFDALNPEPKALNCTSFANLMLSVWRQGNAHAAPYDCSQAVGGLGDQLGPRYAMPEVKPRPAIRSSLPSMS